LRRRSSSESLQEILQCVGDDEDEDRRDESEELGVGREALRQLEPRGARRQAGALNLVSDLGHH